MFLRELIESRMLLENLSKGAENVLKDKRLVAGVAAHLRNDFSLSYKITNKFRKLPDEEVTKWFVEQLDNIERQGYDGIAFSRNGQYHMWIANNYASGADIWEDIEGELGQAMRDYTILKNRDLLDPRHQDIQKYKGVKSLHRYMVQHYAELMKKVKPGAITAALLKSKRSILIADTPEYRVYMIQNRGAAIAFGKGATFCTANSQSDDNFKNYSSKAPLFGLVTNGTDVRGPEGLQVQEKFQFDSGLYRGKASFKNNLDHQVDPEIIVRRFPYLWDDLSKGIRANAQEIEEPSEEGVVKLKYNVANEISKLKQNLADYWTDKKRPAVAPTEPASTGEPPQLAPPA